MLHCSGNECHIANGASRRLRSPARPGINLCRKAPFCGRTAAMVVYASGAQIFAAAPPAARRVGAQEAPRSCETAERSIAGGQAGRRDVGAPQRPLVIHPFRSRGASVTPKVDICKCRSSSAASSIRSPGGVQGEKLHRSSRSSWKRDTEGVRAAVRVCVVRVSSSARRIRRGGTPRPPRGEARCRGRRFTGQRKTGAKRR